MLFHPANLPYWLFLGMGIGLFLLVIVSGGDDGDGDGDLDAEGDGGFEMGQALGWIGFGKAPLILLLATDLSLWGLFGWMLNVTIAGIFGQMPGNLLSGAVLGVSLGLAVAGGGLLARPMGKALATFGEDVSADRLIGCNGTVSSAVIPDDRDGRIGQVNAIDAARNLVSINAVFPEWATVRPVLGDKVLVIDRREQVYFVIVRNSLDEQNWLNSSTSQASQKGDS
ncbi:MAG: DUF1449 family protein [Leptolyngbyaceae cyanobacterium bins.59]|nr:DUF1449 family protein [Leptolyngbyaceae cyanobacterium bins.59]